MINLNKWKTIELWKHWLLSVTEINSAEHSIHKINKQNAILEHMSRACEAVLLGTNKSWCCNTKIRRTSDVCVIFRKSLPHHPGGVLQQTAEVNRYTQVPPSGETDPI